MLNNQANFLLIAVLNQLSNKATREVTKVTMSRRFSALVVFKVTMYNHGTNCVIQAGTSFCGFTIPLNMACWCIAVVSRFMLSWKGSNGENVSQTSIDCVAASRALTFMSGGLF